MRRLGLSFLIACAISVVLLEIGLRVLGLPPARGSDRRFAYMSPGALRNVAPGLAGYQPHARVRHVAFFLTGGEEGPYGPERFEREYDVSYQANDRGLVQRRDIPCGTPVSVVLGDSYGEGQGSPPWFYALEDQRAGRSNLLNLSILGMGALGFERAVIQQRSCFSIRKAVILLIGDDFYRPLGNFEDTELECLNAQRRCTDGQSVFAALDAKASDDDLRIRASERASERFGSIGLWRLLEPRVEILADRVIEGLRREAQLNESVMALTRIVSDLGASNVRLIRLAMKFEAQNGDYSPQTKRAFDLLTATGLTVEDCLLPVHEFLIMDGHPNQVGYDRIRTCVDRALDQLEK